MVQWQNETFPRFKHGFDSRYPLQNKNSHALDECIAPYYDGVSNQNRRHG